MNPPVVLKIDVALKKGDTPSRSKLYRSLFYIEPRSSDSEMTLGKLGSLASGIRKGGLPPQKYS